MKPFSIAIALFAVGLAGAQSKADVPKEIKDVYAAQLADLEKGNLPAFFSYYDPSFVAINPKGKKSNFAQLKADVTRMAKGTTARSVRITYTGCKTKPGMVEVSYIADFTFTGPKMKGKAQISRDREVGTDTWKKVGSAWKEVKTVDKSFGPIK